MQAFADYKPIFESEITGIGEKDTQQVKKNTKAIYKNIIAKAFSHRANRHRQHPHQS